jgi:hypothetical protein
MGEAKRRAQVRQEAREAETSGARYAPKVKQFRAVNIEKRVYDQIRLRHDGPAQKRYPDLTSFVAALLEAGIGVHDHEFAVLDAHLRGESTPVDANANPEPEQLVIPATEVNPAELKTLARLSPGWVGRRTPRG